MDKIGYKAKPNALRYKLPPRDSYQFTCKYFIPCPKFDSEVLFYDESFLEYNNDFKYLLVFLIKDYIIVNIKKGYRLYLCNNINPAIS